MQMQVPQVTESKEHEAQNNLTLYSLVPNIKKKRKIEKCSITPLPSYGIDYSPISIVNPLIRPDGWGVRFPNYHSLAGTYDIVFYFAQWNGDYIHHRTTKGTLTLSVSNQESVYCKERRRFIRRTIPRGGETLKGIVRIDDAVKQGDRIYMGWYNFSFLQNNLRFRVVIDPAFQIDLTKEQIRKANAEIDIHVKGCHDDSKESLDYFKSVSGLTDLSKQPSLRKGGQRRDISMHRGRIKLVAQRGPLRIKKKQSSTYKKKEKCSKNPLQDKSQFCSVKDAEKEYKKYMDVDNSWLSRHIDLPKDVLSVIHQFICPPPVFFFEEGDLWIEVDWNFRQGDLNSIFVARKRTF